jgi:hypothetical protein
MIKNHFHNNRSTPRLASKVLSLTARIDITQVSRDNDLILRETKQYEVNLPDSKLPLTIQFDGRAFILNLTANAELPLAAQLE